MRSTQRAHGCADEVLGHTLQARLIIEMILRVWKLLEYLLRDEAGGKTQRYIYATEIASGYKTTDLLEMKPLKDFEQENNMVRFVFLKNSSSCVGQVPPRRQNSGHSKNLGAKTRKLKVAKKLSGRAEGLRGLSGVRKGRAVGDEVSGATVCKAMEAWWPRIRL